MRRAAMFLVSILAGVPAAHADCASITRVLAGFAADVRCVASPDLTTANPDTTPQDNSRIGLPPYAFTPRTDSSAVSPDAPNRTTIFTQVPGLQVTGSMSDDPDARWVLRLPDDWNGRLVVGIPGGMRSEFMGDYIFSDFVLQQRFAYVSTNKGTLNFYLSNPVTDSLACRVSPPPAPTAALIAHFYLAEVKDTISEWFRRTLEATDVAELAAAAHYEQLPARVYLFGISNGGHVVRRLLAESPARFHGGIDWEGVYWSPAGPNILIDLPVALRLWPGYRDSGLSRASSAWQAMLAAGYPPDLAASPPTPANSYSPLLGSFWETHLNNYWDVTTCLFAKELDPLYPDTPEAYDYGVRRKPHQLSPRIGRISTGGDIQRPMITLHGTMDALLPLVRHARPFRDAVLAAGRADLHRLYEIQNGNHIEKYRQSCCNFVQLEFIQPHAHRAFDLLVDWVENGMPAPPSQCVARGGEILPFPKGTEHCAQLLAQ